MDQQSIKKYYINTVRSLLKSRRIDRYRFKKCTGIKQVSALPTLTVDGIGVLMGCRTKEALDYAWSVCERIVTDAEQLEILLQVKRFADHLLCA